MYNELQEGFSAECTKPSHAQSLASSVIFVASSRKEFPQREQIFAISFAKPFAFAREFLRNAYPEDPSVLKILRRSIP